MSSYPQWECRFGKIEFSKLGLTRPPFFKKASKTFYDAIYKEMSEETINYQNLPEYFTKAKTETAANLKSHLKDKRILSWGCGTAYMENVHFPDEDITLVDLSLPAKNLGERQVFKATEITGWRGDVVIGIQMVFHLSNEEVNQFFKNCGQLLVTGGKVIITHTAAKSFYFDFFKTMKNFAKVLIQRRKFYVLWGWRRQNSTYASIAFKNGFRLVDVVTNKVNKEQIMVFTKQDDP